MIGNILKFARPRKFIPQLILAHTETCPARNRSKGDFTSNDVKLQRATHTGKVRLGFIPDEWFLFFQPKTGVSGPYIFGLMLTNYLVSKEIYVMEHEYYTGLSIFVIVYYASTRFGPQIGSVLDKEVDAYQATFEKAREDDKKSYEAIVEGGKDAQLRAQAQKLLMEAKRENVVMQLEAAYRERMMMVYQGVKSRLDYQVKLHQTQTRIHQKWMIDWILLNVMKSITPEFQQQFLGQAIHDIAILADKPK